MSATPSPEGLADVLRQLVALGHEENKKGKEVAGRPEEQAGSNSGAHARQVDAPVQRAEAGEILDA